MTRYLLDSSFAVDLLNEIADHDDEGASIMRLRNLAKLAGVERLQC